MTTLAQEFESMKRAMKVQEQRKCESSKYRTVNTFKWRLLMIQNLEKLSLSLNYDRSLLEDLKNLVTKIAEEKFVEAIINLQAYKPNFRSSYELSHPKRQPRKITKPIKFFQLSPTKDQDETTTSCSLIIRKQSQQMPAAKKMKLKQQLIAIFIEDDVLSHEFSSSNHPYNKIIEGYCTILENKYKKIIQKQINSKNMLKIDEMVQFLSQDFKLIQNFFKMSSNPIVDIFSLHDHKEKQKATEQISNFIINYLRNNQKICVSFRKILRYYVKNSLQLKSFTDNCPISAQIQKFGLPERFQIEGCFVYTASELISFVQLSKGKDCLSKLALIRDSIYKDIDEYYRNDEKNSSMQVSSEVQLEILKFSIVKLQIFAGEILSQLKLLQILYGSEEISYHFDEASYIHSQLSIAFEAIQQNL